MQLFDTHCHIHEATFELKGDDATRSLWAKAGKPDPADLIQQSVDGGVVGMICVGTTADDSALAVRFVQNHANCWASIGIHPHEAKNEEFRKLAGLLDSSALRPERFPTSQAAPADKQSPDAAGKASLRDGETARGATKPEAIPANDQDFIYGGTASNPVLSGTEGGEPHRTELSRASTVRRGPRDEAQDTSNKIVAIGECGLDYFYSHSPKEDQVKALRFQIELALTHDLPMIFHVRDAFDDFWPIFDDYKGIRGVVHSFTDNQANLDKILARDLYVGLNGIITFTKNDWQLKVAKAIPLNNLVCETDAPFLTPAPIRGRVNAPVNVRLVAEFLAELRGESLKDFAEATTHNAHKLFNL